MTTGQRRTAVVCGVGEGLGLAIAKRFAAGDYCVVMLARNKEKLTSFETEIKAQGGDAVGMKVDARIELDVVNAMRKIETEIGPIEAAIYNASAQHRKPLLEITREVFEKVWRLACFGGLVFGREAVRHKVVPKEGSVIFTGATSSTRGAANFGAFASAKFGLRAVAQSLERESFSQGIHVATVVIDGAVDMPAIHEMFPQLRESVPPDGLMEPAAVAENYFQIHKQHRCAWTLETQVRPYCETF
jgi:NAD(P)-dependent dehydrogenase (short-subunit alcohol dehydrogenase family)